MKYGVSRLASDEECILGGRGGGLVDIVADSGPYDPSSIPLGEKKENKRKRGRGWPLLKKECKSSNTS